MSRGCGCANCVAQVHATDGVTSTGVTLRGALRLRERAPASAPAPRPARDYDTPHMRRLADAQQAIRAAHPELSPYETAMRAQELVSGGADRDPGRLELHLMAERYMREHPRASYREALIAVSREYDRLAYQPIAAVDRGNEQLAERAERYMREHPNVKFRTALLEVSRVDAATNIQTVQNPPYPAPGSAAKLDADTHSVPLSVEEVEAYAKKKGLTYKEALIAIDAYAHRKGIGQRPALLELDG